MNSNEVVQLVCPAQALKSETTRERIAAGGCRSAAATASSTTIARKEAVPSWFVRCVIVVLAGGLHELQWDGRQAFDVISNNYWSNDEDKEDNKHEEVEDREADDSSPAQLRLLK